MSTPPRPASTIVIIHATRRRPRRVHAAEAGERLAVDDGAHLEADTGAPDHEPEHDRGERGDDEHRDLVGVQHDARRSCSVSWGVGPDTGNRQTLVDRVVALEAEVEHVVADRHDQPLDQRGQRDEQTDGADDAAYTGAFANRRSRMRSSSSPSSGAKMNTEMISAGTMGTPSPVLSW